MNLRIGEWRIAMALLWLAVISGLIIDPRLPPALGTSLIWLDMTVQLGVIAWVGWLALRARRVPWELLTAWALLALISLPNGSDRLLKMLFFIAVFVLGQMYFNPNGLRRAARLIAIVYIPLALLRLGNPNALAMTVWALALLGGYWPVTLAGLGVILYLGSQGGALALLAGALYAQWGWRGLIAPLAALPGAVWLKWDSSSVQTRLAMLREAGEGFSASPWLGQGVGAFNSGGFRLPHNIWADAAYSAGLVGLLMLAAGAYWLWRERATLSGYGAFFIALAVHSMLDNAYWYVPGLLAAFVIGGALDGRNENATI